MATKVVFRKWKDGEIIALFPDKPWSRHDYTTASYMHLGQHGAADYTGVIAATRPAKEQEYRDLLDELKTIGYSDLHIVQRAYPKFN
jgi:hypothetical protein|nr:MAG TPA: hypothetical protein [Bacteriophage sp.]